ncbi:hypothetical protein BU24DRAFT_417707 [Aaosphaeria arxii CBS 175.79]|uniref:Uncharacterized protein n=1 Tax=Aaosphaeria arxii CBS 175.79 TaxID=1450172 RepID=A0A6A5YBH5_9PLEO|nr:uncharacterized protein BU24DRAFT_417707 [Aaosphaeria arxii CBS 175.79]KAF2022061.1 hypothetical protein BU24DRAFT_417707 [Aaosphaeria arxii CBS 175.79]
MNDEEGEGGHNNYNSIILVSYLTVVLGCLRADLVPVEFVRKARSMYLCLSITNT